MESLDARAFDFWVGEWDCEFAGGHAVNTVTHEFEGAVLREDFVADAPRTWHGMSVSAFHPIDEPSLIKRMVFSSITPESFQWRWESSPDEQSWTENWAISYTRRT